jgi:hypothetical protein
MYFSKITHFYYYSRLFLILTHHFIADIISEKYKQENKTTTRDIPFDTKNEIIPYFIKKYYAISQLFATGILLLSINPDNGFMIMFPIQLSAFLMTLVRKNIISNNHWHIFYSLSLAIPYILNNKIITSSNNQVLPVIIYTAFRLLFNTNKYLNMIVLSLFYVMIYV